MSSPVEKNRDRPDGWMYAPRWAQDGEDVPYVPSPQLAAPAEPAEPQNFDELAAHLAASMAQVLPAARAGEPQPHEFATVPEWMHKARALEPVAMPMPPMREPSRFRLAYAVRALAFATVAAAGAYVFVYGLPEQLVRLADARLFTRATARRLRRRPAGLRSRRRWSRRTFRAPRATGCRSTSRCPAACRRAATRSSAASRPERASR